MSERPNCPGRAFPDSPDFGSARLFAYRQFRGYFLNFSERRIDSLKAPIKLRAHALVSCLHLPNCCHQASVAVRFSNIGRGSSLHHFAHEHRTGQPTEPGGSRPAICRVAWTALSSGRDPLHDHRIGRTAANQVDGSTPVFSLVKGHPDSRTPDGRGLVVPDRFPPSGGESWHGERGSATHPGAEPPLPRRAPLRRGARL